MRGKDRRPISWRREGARRGGEVEHAKDAFGAHAEPPSLVIEAGPFAARKLAALLCHQSQMAASPIASITPDDATRLLGTEHFRRAPVGAPGSTFLDALSVTVS